MIFMVILILLNLILARLMKKKIALLGSTGSIGVNALKVIRDISESYEIVNLSGNMNADIMIQQCKEFQPKSIVMINEEASELVRKGLSGHDINVLSGRKNLLNISKYVSILLYFKTNDICSCVICSIKFK